MDTVARWLLILCVMCLWIGMAAQLIVIFVGSTSPIISWQSLFAFGGALVIGFLVHAATREY